MQSIITFDDKVALYENADIPEINKVTDDNINEIKSIVNGSLQGTNAMGSIVVDDVTCKNMFNSGLSIATGEYYDNTTGAITTTGSANNYLQEAYIKVQPNTQYTISSASGSTFLRVVEYTNNRTFIKTNSSGTSNTMTITTTATTEYVRLSMVGADVLTTLQLEQGSTATTYTPYKAFANEEIYSTNEVRIGTWIDGSDLYRKGFSGTTSSNTQTQLSVSNVSKLINSGGYVVFDSNYSLPVNTAFGTSGGNDLRIIKVGTGITLQTSQELTGKTFEVWCEYTKTTSGTRSIETTQEETR